MIYIVYKIDESDEVFHFDCVHAFSDEEQARNFSHKLNCESRTLSIYYNIKEVPLN